MLFRVLGPVEIRDAGGASIEVAAGGQRRLLGLLLVRANAWVDAAEVGEALGGGNDRTGVHHLRQILPRTADGSPRINGRSGRYRLNVAPHELDAAAFEGQVRRARAAGDQAVAAAAYRDALGLWRGRPYDGFKGGDVVDGEAERLTRLLWTARDGLADALVALGQHADAAALLRPLVAEDPGRRATWERLVSALYADGLRDEAATTLRQASRALGGDPGHTLRDLHERLLSEDDPAAAQTQRVPIFLNRPSTGAAADWRPAYGRLAGERAEGRRPANTSPARGQTADGWSTSERDGGGRPADGPATHGRTTKGRTDSEPSTGDQLTRDQPGGDSSTGDWPADDLPADVRRLTEEERPWTDWRVERVHQPRRRAAVLLGALAVVAALTLLGVAALASLDGRLLGSSSEAGSSSAQTTPARATSTQTSVAATSPPPAGISPRRAIPGQPAPAPGGTPSLLFGVGPAADAASTSALVGRGHTHLLSTRYRGHDDLATVVGWRDSVINRAYAGGFALHLVLDDGSAPAAVATSFGTGCGRPYPLSSDFIADVTQLAITFGGTAGGPPLFVTMFDGVESYACTGGAALADEASTTYYRALLGRYLETREIFHKLAPNALVGLGWRSSLTSYDDPNSGAGRSMFGHFGDALRLSDFTSVSAASDKGNVDDVRAAVLELGEYAPVLVSYDAPAAVAGQDLRGILTEDFLREAVGHGLFAWTFSSGLTSDRTTSAFVADAAEHFGRNAR